MVIALPYRAPGKLLNFTLQKGGWIFKNTYNSNIFFETGTDKFFGQRKQDEKS